MKRVMLKTTDEKGHVRLLEGHPLFRGVETEWLGAFADQAQILTHPKGKVIYLQDDRAESFYLIMSGWVKLFRETVHGDEAVVDVLTVGHVFGESSVFEEDCYATATQAVEDVRLLAMPTALLKTTIENSSIMARNMLRVMAQMRRAQSKEIEHLSLQSAPQRIGCFLLRLCPPDTSKPVTLHLPYDKTLLASRLGMKPETFSRALAKLKEHANLTISGPTVHIPNMQHLVGYTCSHCTESFPCEDLK